MVNNDNEQGFTASWSGLHYVTVQLQQI